MKTTKLEESEKELEAVYKEAGRLKKLLALSEANVEKFV